LVEKQGIFPQPVVKIREQPKLPANCDKRTEHKKVLDGLSNAQAMRNVKEEAASCGLENLRKNSTCTRVTGLELCMV
jgi:hypothetical protein